MDASDDRILSAVPLFSSVPGILEKLDRYSSRQVFHLSFSREADAVFALCRSSEERIGGVNVFRNRIVSWRFNQSAETRDFSTESPYLFLIDENRYAGEILPENNIIIRNFNNQHFETFSLHEDKQFLWRGGVRLPVFNMTAMAYETKSGKIAAGMMSGRICVYDRSTSAMLFSVLCQQGYVENICYDTSGVDEIAVLGKSSFAGGESLISILDGVSGILKARFRHMTADENEITRTISYSSSERSRIPFAYSSAGKIAAVGTNNGVKIYDVPSGTMKFWVPLVADSAKKLAPELRLVLSACGERLFCSLGETVRVIDAKRGIELGALNGHRNVITAIAIAKDQRTLATGDREGIIAVWSF